MPHPPPCGGRGGMLNIGTAGEEEPAVGVKFGAAGEAVTAVPAGKSVAAGAEIGGGGRGWGSGGEDEPELGDGAGVAGLLRPSCFPRAACFLCRLHVAVNRLPTTDPWLVDLVP